MWSSGRRKRLRRAAEGYEAVIVLGCGSATETVRAAVESVGCRVIEGMEVVGFMNARMEFRLPANGLIEGCETLPIRSQNRTTAPAG